MIASTDALFALSGLFNVVLFALTRPGLIPRNRSCAAHSALQAHATSAGRIEHHLSGDGIDTGADRIDLWKLARLGSNMRLYPTSKVYIILVCVMMMKLYVLNSLVYYM